MMDSKPVPIPHVEVSVVISTRNRAAWLPDCLTGLARQDTEVPFEVVIIDNGSTDDTAQILGDWCDRDDRFQTATEERVGLSLGKNRGIRLARAQTILFTDDDVIVDPSWISSYVDFFHRHASGLAVAGGRIAPVPHDLGPWPNWFGDDMLVDLALLDHGAERPLTRGEYVWGANMAVPRAFFERFGTWDETIGNREGDRETFEDAEFQDRVRAEGVDVWFCPRASINHRVDRARIDPAHILENAFSRGRNDVFAPSVISRGPAPSSWPKEDLLPGVLRLAWSLARWAVATLVFRVRPSRKRFSRARRMAHASGRSLERLRGGRGHSFEPVGRIGLFARKLILRVIRHPPT
jgi:glycosyltransferase involved in cell wall biosynthesis